MELSIEEKAQRYDEAIEQLRAMMPNWERLSYNGKTFLQDLTYILPELQESEDEMIRRVLIQETKGSEERLFEAVTNEEFIAWLEKKGEQDERIRKELIQGTKVPGVEFFRAVTKANEEFIARLTYKPITEANDEFIARLEKKGEQKPTDKAEPKFRVKYAGSEYNVLEVKDIAGITFYGIEDEPNHIDYVLPDHCEIIRGYGWFPSPTYPTDKCEGCNNAKGCVACVDGSEYAHIEEKNPYWSEEDKRKINRIYSILGQAADTHAYSTTCRLIGDKECIELQDFLKALKERVGCEVNCTTTREWSEEDDQYLLVCKNALEKYQTTDKWDAKIISRWLEDKLKSIRPQSQWKPSDRQIIALRWVLNNILYNTHKEEISGLLEQILKLREE